MRAERQLRPLLLEALVPVAQAMARLEERQQETRALVEHLASRSQETAPETRELLLEVLNSLQPPPVQELSQRLGLPTPSP